jgi:hypothetical protein
MAGYSGTPLAKKLGIKSGMTLHVVNAPREYAAMVSDLPENVGFSSAAADGLDMVHVFTSGRAELGNLLRAFRKKIKQDGVIWVSWPKKSSPLSGEITEDTVREAALAHGLVDVKVCAVDQDWSALKLVIRKENRR